MDNLTKLNELEQRCQSLQSENDLLRSIFDTIAEGIAIADSTTGMLLYSNKAFCSLFRYDQTEVQELHFGQLHPPELLQSAIVWFYDLQNREKPKMKVKCLRKDKSVFISDIYDRTIVYQSRICNLATFIDATSRYETEEQLKEKTDLLDSFMKYSPVYAYIKEVTYQSSIVLFATENFKDMVGIPGSQMVGKNMEELFPPEFARKIAADDWEVVSSGKLKRLDEELNDRYYNTIKFPIFRGDKYLLAGYTIDITERKMMEEALIESEQKLKELIVTKDKLFSIIAHDMRGPFNAILGYSELLVNNIRDFSVTETEMFIETIYVSVRNTLDLLENLLSWAKAQTGQLKFKPSHLNLKTIVDDITAILDASAILKKISVLNSIPDNIIVFADDNMLHTVFRNLLSNAIKYTNVMGEVNIEAYIQDNTVWVTVSDNGVGIDEAVIQNLFKFEVFNSTKGTADENGSGLGLVLCKEFIERMGGAIRVESKPGEGSRFIFSLPANDPEGIKCF